MAQSIYEACKKMEEKFLERGRTLPKIDPTEVCFSETVKNSYLSVITPTEELNGPVKIFTTEEKRQRGMEIFRLEQLRILATGGVILQPDNKTHTDIWEFFKKSLQLIGYVPNSDYIMRMITKKIKNINTADLGQCIANTFKMWKPHGITEDDPCAFLTNEDDTQINISKEIDKYPTVGLAWATEQMLDYETILKEGLIVNYNPSKHNTPLGVTIHTMQSLGQKDRMFTIPDIVNVLRNNKDMPNEFKKKTKKQVYGIISAQFRNLLCPILENNSDIRDLLKPNRCLVSSKDPISKDVSYGVCESFVTCDTAYLVTHIKKAAKLIHGKNSSPEQIERGATDIVEALTEGPRQRWKKVAPISRKKAAKKNDKLGVQTTDNRANEEADDLDPLKNLPGADLQPNPWDALLSSIPDGCTVEIKITKN